MSKTNLICHAAPSKLQITAVSVSAFKIVPKDFLSVSASALKRIINSKISFSVCNAIWTTGKPPKLAKSISSSSKEEDLQNLRAFLGKTFTRLTRVPGFGTGYVGPLRPQNARAEYAQRGLFFCAKVRLRETLVIVPSESLPFIFPGKEHLGAIMVVVVQTRW